MESNEDKDIRWQKLDEELGKPMPNPANTSLTKEEWSLLLFIKRLRARLKPVNMQQQFPIDQGWIDLKTRIETSEDAIDASAGGKLVKLKWTRYAAAAVVLVLVAAGAFWMFGPGTSKPGNQQAATPVVKQKADLAPTEEVTLILADGKTIAMEQKQSITDNNGLAIKTTDGAAQYLPSGKETVLAASPNKLIVPRGKKYRLTLVDGTDVWVNAASTLTYPSNFKGKTREITLEGEAYFDVKSDPEKPFIVHAKGVEALVLGTSFNVNSYEHDLYATLRSGKIKVSGSGNSVVLEPGEQSRYNSGSGSMRKEKVNVGMYLAWKDGDVYFEDASLEEITRSLSRMFDYDFEFADPALKAMRFTVDMGAPRNLQEVLDRIAGTSDGLKFEVNGRTVRISK